MVEINGVATKASVEEIAFYDKVVGIIREAGYNEMPDFESTRLQFRHGKPANVVANKFMAKWSVE